MSRRSLTTRRFILGGVMLSWLLIVIGGWLALSDYSQRAGAASVAPRKIEVGVTQDTARLQLLVFLHPKCACSLSTVRELERTLARCNGQVAADIYFYQPSSQTDQWAYTALWDMAQAIPNVELHLDRDGAEACRFGVKTSGSVLLYDKHGQLCFQGGLTTARGHEGDSAGKQAILLIARGKLQSAPSTRVFGCSLISEQRPAESVRHETP